MRWNGEDFDVRLSATRRQIREMIVRPTLTTIAAGIAKMSPAQARRRWDLLVGAAFSQQGRPDDFASALDFNARLATALRENGASKLIWEEE